MEAQSEKNQEFIEAAVKKLNYFPNNTARWLRTSKTYRVGVIAGIVNSPHTSAILNEIEKKLRDHGYSVSFSVLTKIWIKQKNMWSI